ncbi:MAG: helix-turn-helix transcriptional regulator [Clostridia bacterium]|nr:helix-turn-helix transcriptional regulator [Clostridia bacterium]
MRTQEKSPTRSRDFDAEIILGPNATIGDKVKALRLSRKMTIASLARASGLSDRAIRYIENNERTPGAGAVQQLADALEVRTDIFMDPEIFEQTLHKEEFLQQAKEKYGSRGMAQARHLVEQAHALYAGGELSDADRAVFRQEMEAIFWDSQQEAQKFTPKARK